jgi:ubiquinone/menaquinone biosynthesis C-methylase UbiE
MPKTMERYITSCGSEFWQKIFIYELAYLVSNLEGCREILSVGCGPAIIEGGLVKHGFNLTGLDVSREALDRAPKGVRTVEARAEEMPFMQNSFDAIIFLASLEFVEEFCKALDQAAFVLRPNGRIIILLLNPESDFFKRKIYNPDSYVHRIKHKGLKKIEAAVNKRFDVQTEYFLSISGDKVLERSDGIHSISYILKGSSRAY